VLVVMVVVVLWLLLWLLQPLLVLVLLLLLLLLRQLLLPWLLQAVIRRPKEDRGNSAAGDLGEGWQINLVASLQPLGGLL
jgi:hypothetical protein